MGTLIIIGSIGLWVFGFAVGRNNPNISSVNKAIAAGKFIVAAGNKIVKKL